MKRRSAIRHLVVITGGTVLFPSCFQQQDKIAVKLSNISLKESQQKLLAELTGTIIPQASTPGAVGLGAPLFVLMMMNDCYNKEDQDRFLKGLSEFDALYAEKQGRSFVESDAKQRISFLQQLGAQKDKREAVDFFINTTKQLTIQAYTTSKYFLTEVQPYEIIPGRYHGCVSVPKTDRKKV